MLNWNKKQSDTQRSDSSKYALISSNSLKIQKASKILYSEFEWTENKSWFKY